MMALLARLPNMTAMQAVLLVGAIAILASFWRAHRDHDFAFNAFDLLMENGRVSKLACYFMLVLLVTTWIVINQEINGRLTEGIFGLYLTAWVSPLVAKLIFGKTDMPGTSITSTTTISATEKASP